MYTYLFVPIYMSNYGKRDLMVQNLKNLRVFYAFGYIQSSALLC